MGFVEVPVFTGESGAAVKPWIDWMEQYFARCVDITELQKEAMAYGFLEGDALRWYCEREFNTWNDLRNALLMEYGDDSEPEHYWLLVEQDPVLGRLRTSEIQDSTSFKPEEKDSSLQGTKSCYVTELIEKKEIKDDSSTPITETNVCAATDSTLETNCVHQNESVLYPQVSFCILESGRRDMRLGDFETDIAIMDQKRVIQEVLHPIFDDLQSQEAETFQKFPCVETENGAHHMFDVLSHKAEMTNLTREKDKLSKSWKFKFKQRHQKSRRLQLAQLKLSIRKNNMNRRLCPIMILKLRGRKHNKDIMKLLQNLKDTTLGDINLHLRHKWRFKRHSIMQKTVLEANLNLEYSVESNALLGIQEILLQLKGDQVNKVQLLQVGRPKVEVAQRQGIKSAEDTVWWLWDKSNKDDAEPGLYAVFHRIIHSYKLLLLHPNISENWLDRFVQCCDVRRHMLNRKWHFLLLNSTNLDMRISSLVWHCWKNKHLQSIRMKKVLLQVRQQDKNGFLLLKRVKNSLLGKMRMKLIERGLNQSIVVVGEFKMKHKWRDKLTQQAFELKLFLNRVVIILGADIWCDYLDKMMVAILLLQRLMIQPKQKQTKCNKAGEFKYSHKIKELAKWDITTNHLLLIQQTSLWFCIQVNLFHVQLQQQMKLHQFSKSKLCKYNTIQKIMLSLDLTKGCELWRKQSLYVLLQFFSFHTLEDKLSSNGGVLIRHEEYSREVKTIPLVLVRGLTYQSCSRRSLTESDLSCHIQSFSSSLRTSLSKGKSIDTFIAGGKERKSTLKLTKADWVEEGKDSETSRGFAVGSSSSLNTNRLHHERSMLNVVCCLKRVCLMLYVV